jgi:hypothetical protein
MLRKLISRVLLKARERIVKRRKMKSQAAKRTLRLKTKNPFQRKKRRKIPRARMSSKMDNNI